MLHKLNNMKICLHAAKLPTGVDIKIPCIRILLDIRRAAKKEEI